MTRNCPQCNSTITYKNRVSYDKAIKKNTICKKCASKNSGFIDRYGTKGKSTGSDNPFYGKKHTAEVKEKIRNLDRSSNKTITFRVKMSQISKGKNNPMYGKTFYQIWVDKYGEEKAKMLLDDFKKKKSIASSGKNNNMYGKPSPKKSGNGWGGYYNGWFFRSLRELSYMVDVIEKNNYHWESAEKSEYKIEYIDFDGKTRSYFADFIIDNKTMVEIKPYRLINSPKVSLKIKYAIIWCEKNGYEYQILDQPILKINQLKSMLDNDSLVFLKKEHENFIRSS